MCTHLTKRGSRYSIRRKIPLDLQGHYGRTEIMKALDTSDRREAEQLCRVAGAKLDAEFASARASLLHPDNVYEETYRKLDGSERSAWVLRITDEGPGQALKTPGSCRRIPIHAELIRPGFVDYGRKAKGRNRIFDKLVKDTVGDESGNWSKWFGSYLRAKAEVTDTRMVFHSFRHTFKHEARAMETSEDVSDAITGHASGKVSRNYGGTDYPLRPLVEAMARFRINGFNLAEPPP